MRSVFHERKKANSSVEIVMMASRNRGTQAAGAINLQPHFILHCNKIPYNSWSQFKAIRCLLSCRKPTYEMKTSVVYDPRTLGK